MVKYDNITTSVARIVERDHWRFAWMQAMLILDNSASSLLTALGHKKLDDRLMLTPISNLFIAPSCIVIPSFKPYMIISFDYKMDYDCEIIKVSEGCTTTHFKEKISLS